VDRAFSEQLNLEQGLPFSLPYPPVVAKRQGTLQQQLNAIIETRSTSSGLLLGIPDVLFGFNQYTLTPAAREKLGKIAAILSGYRGLSIRLDGHTDNIGSEPYNRQLSKKRAEAVLEFLVAHGVPAAKISASGFGAAKPVASNATIQGRQQNRRVDMLISGDVTGTAVTWVR
jgi:outer membrane protein OmpA-like peptidoglycan-associated protein